MNNVQEEDDWRMSSKGVMRRSDGEKFGYVTFSSEANADNKVDSKAIRISVANLERFTDAEGTIRVTVRLWVESSRRLR
ncbi:hypothetical protein PRIPAC_89218 [Pristionchus pacificus]|uniref:Uncharacterized protein n=1 Tax=Pristionchus pacificus TaxID=54126 RepID=A0A2A6CZ99_PRIPA|nr:hypothetical protein PRIPAC_89218 [Pristionchus pacificus]|eukprot:PDM83387.1 hypothetical protein PRIPAC_35019 [Pristionchus pacificus]